MGYGWKTMNSDLARLTLIALAAHEDWVGQYGRMSPAAAEEIVRAVLTALRDATGETERYAAGEWSRRNVEAMVEDILSEPATS